MKEFVIFVCTDSTELFFSKLRSAGLNYNVPNFFTDSYCAGGIYNKHCLLTFFILTAKMHALVCNSYFSLEEHSVYYSNTNQHLSACVLLDNWTL